jgi:ABC-type polysaccharide/polyol phosphate transport system ATPase subunit
MSSDERNLIKNPAGLSSHTLNGIEVNIGNKSTQLGLVGNNGVKQSPINKLASGATLVGIVIC